MSQPNTPAKGKATRKKAGLSTFQWCQQCVQVSVTLFLKQLLNQPECQVNTWQLMSMNSDLQCSSDISVIAEKLLGPVRMRARVPVLFSIQETRSWDVPNLELPGYVCVMVTNLGSPRCWFRNSYATLRARASSKRDVQRFSLEPLWWPFTLQTAGRTWRYVKHSVRVSRRCCGMDVVAVPENSTLQRDLNVGLG